MITLWIILILLSLIACGFIFFAFTNSSLLKTKKAEHEEKKNWYLKEISGLKNLRFKNQISAEYFAAENLRLQKDLLAENQDKNLTNPHSSTYIILAAIIFVLSFSLICYLNLGASKKLYEKKLLDQKNQKELIAFQKMGNINEIISRLKKQVFLHPKDAQGWYLLGQLYFSQNQFTNAEAAFNKAEILAPNRKDIFIQKIEAAYLSNNPKLPELLNQALKNAPDDPSLLNIQALIFYQQKKYDQALNIWQNLLLQAPKNSDAANALEQAIKSTEAKINHISA